MYYELVDMFIIGLLLNTWAVNNKDGNPGSLPLDQMSLSCLRHFEIIFKALKSVLSAKMLITVIL
jgi:hypothetical protein